MDVFFCEEDRQAYLDLLREMGDEHGVTYWGYCLMSNHVHLIAVPRAAESLALGIGRAHQAYTRRINFRENWRGYLWQGRFFSCPLDERHAALALRYVERNPVRARLVKRAEDWDWSSARGHVSRKRDALTTPAPFIESARAWRALLGERIEEQEVRLLRERTRTGRPLGGGKFIARLERMLSRRLHPAKRGPRPQATKAKPTRKRKAGGRKPSPRMKRRR